MRPARRHSPPPRVSAVITVERDNGGPEVDEVLVEVSGVYVPAERGGRYEPPSGEGFEDLEARMVLGGAEVDLSWSEEQTAVEKLLEAMR